MEIHFGSCHTGLNHIRFFSYIAWWVIWHMTFESLFGLAFSHKWKKLYRIILEANKSVCTFFLNEPWGSAKRKYMVLKVSKAVPRNLISSLNGFIMIKKWFTVQFCAWVWACVMGGAHVHKCICAICVLAWLWMSSLLLTVKPHYGFMVLA